MPTTPRPPAADFAGRRDPRIALECEHDLMSVVRIVVCAPPRRGRRRRTNAGADMGVTNERLEAGRDDAFLGHVRRESLGE